MKRSGQTLAIGKYIEQYQSKNYIYQILFSIFYRILEFPRNRATLDLKRDPKYVEEIISTVFVIQYLMEEAMMEEASEPESQTSNFGVTRVPTESLIVLYKKVCFISLICAALAL